MNKKILIGSIIAVAILILVSFTSVVGYNSVTSDIKVSPLFTVRSSRALDKESKGLTCDYVGKGEEISIQLPTRDNKIHSIQKFIGRMDDKTFNRFVALVISRLNQDDKIKDVDTLETINALHRLRNVDYTVNWILGYFLIIFIFCIFFILSFGTCYTCHTSCNFCPPSVVCPKTLNI